jgi:putative membrane protein
MAAVSSDSDADDAEIDSGQSGLVPARVRRLRTLYRRQVMNIVQNIEAALIFAVIGITVFVMAFVIIDRLTPYQLWREIVEEKNMALAVLVGAMSIGICIIIAAAVH